MGQLSLLAYWPCHWRDGTAGTPGAYLPLLPKPGLNAISDDYWRRMDLAAAAASRATCMSLLCAGWSSWRTRAGTIPHYWTVGYATAGSGLTHQSGARDSELQRPPVNVACAWVLL